MSMADTIAVMNDGRIEQAGGAADLYERPRTEFVANFLGVSNLVDARLRASQNGHSTVETHDGATLHVPSDRIGPHGTDAVRIGVRPEKVRLSPAGAERRRRRQRPARHGRRGLVPRRVDPVRRPRRGRRGAHRLRTEPGRGRAGVARTRPGGPARLGPAAHLRRSQGGVMTDPRFERALEQYLEAQRLSRRRFLGRAGSAGLAVTGLSTLLAACGGVEGTAEKAEERERGAGQGGQPPEDRDRRLDVLQLAALHGQGAAEGVRQGVRRQGPLPRGHQRQLRVLREGPPAARERPADRARHRRPHRLHGRALGAQRLRRADRQEERPERVEHRRQPRVDQLRRGPHVHAPVPVGRDRHRLQHQGDRRRARRPSPTSSTRSSRAA